MRRPLLPALAALAFALLAALPARAWDFSPEQLKEYEDITQGEVSRENPPSLDRPQFITAYDAALYLDDSDVVFLLEDPPDHGEPLVFPQRIMVRHGVVNMRVANTRFSVTYSPLAGTLACWLGKVDSFDTSFGPSGQTLNSVMLLYDRSTLTFWTQHTGLALRGRLAGLELTGLPMFWTTWGKVFALYPKARVLSRQTGRRYDYSRDPYGSYQKRGTYYDTGGPLYRVSFLNPSLPAKTPILALRQGKVSMALVIEALRRDRASNVPFGLTPLAVFWDEELGTARVFSASLGRKVLHFVMQGQTIVDDETRSTWNAHGVCLEGRLRGKRLDPLPATPAMWFAWTAFFPKAMVYE